MIWKIFLVIAVLFFITDIYIYALYRSRKRKKRISVFRRILFFLPSVLLMLFGLGYFFYYKQAGLLYSDNMAGLMWFSLISCFFLIPKFLFMIISVWDLLFKFVFRVRMRFFTYLGVLAALAVVIIFIIGVWVDRDKLEVKRINLYSEQLPPAFSGLKIVQISDLHIGNLVKKDAVISRMVAFINSENPDIIVFTGDLVNLSAAELDGTEKYLSKLKAKEGIFSILGNHDYADYRKWDSLAEKEENLQYLIKSQENFGWKMLNNASVTLCRDSDFIAVIGTENWGEPPFHQYGDLEKAMAGVENIPFKILLTHNPVHWSEKVVNQKDIFLTLAGHTHAMQLRFNIIKPVSPASLRYKYWEGLHYENDQYLYVNTGIGYVGIPFRFGVRPEITVIEIESKGIHKEENSSNKKENFSNEEENPSNSEELEGFDDTM